MKQPVIMFTNQKGGCGKTTTSRELSLFTASLEKTVCVIDTDPQGNLSKSLVDETDIASGLYEALTDQEYDLIPVKGTLRLLAGDKRLAAEQDHKRFQTLRFVFTNHTKTNCL